MYHRKSMWWVILFLSLVGLFPFIQKSKALEGWPAEPSQEAQILTQLDPDFVKNLSGAHWNTHTRTLWVCLNNPGKFWAIRQNTNGTFEIDYQGLSRGEWSPGGDLEGITQADLDEPSVYVMVEGSDLIRKYDVSQYGVVRPPLEWNISPHVPPYGGSLGSEGITFVPDFWLNLYGFVNGEGEPYTSLNGMGGLMFVAHQNGGGIYVFDLDPNGGSYDFVGKYLSSQPESSGLEFDRTSGTLYIWHNTGSNFLELSDLRSFAKPDGQRQFVTLKEFIGPRAGNLEGIAVTPVSSEDHWIFITDDDNLNGTALMWFQDFLPGIELPTFTTELRVASSEDDAEERANGSMYLNSSDLELVEDSSRQVVGVRFSGLEVPAGATITKAYLQFTVDEITANATSLRIYGENSSNAFAYASAQQNISLRSKTTHFVDWYPEAWAVLAESGEKEQTPDLSSVIQEIVSSNNWTSGNAVAFMIEGFGKRVAKSYNGAPAFAPLLHVEYTLQEYEVPASPINIVDLNIASPGDDAEERANGSMYLNSSDLELVEESSLQVVGMRFAPINIPQGATITNATIQFTTDEVSAGEVALTIHGELSDFAEPFSTGARNISLRRTTSAMVPWAPQSWNAIGQTSEAQRTENLNLIVQEIIDRQTWISGNPMVFIITGSGKRVAKSYEGSRTFAPRLHIEYQSP